MVPLDVQAAELPAGDADALGAPTPRAPRPWRRCRPARPPAAVAEVADAPRAAPSGRRSSPGAARSLAGAGPALRALGERTGALLATSAVGQRPVPRRPVRPRHRRRLLVAARRPAARRVRRHRGLRRRAQPVDDAPRRARRPRARASSRSTSTPTRSARTARSTPASSATPPRPRRRCCDAVPARAGRRSPELAAEIAAGAGATSRSRRAPHGLDPRALSIALDDLLPEERTVVVDSGHFMGWPSMYLRVPDAAGFVFPQAFQCVGLGLGNAIGAALARPGPADRRGARRRRRADGAARARDARPARPAAARRDLRRRGLRRRGAPLPAARARPSTSPSSRRRTSPRSPRRRAAAGSTARSVADLDGVRDWLRSPDRPLVLDAKVDPDICADWLEEAFRGH